MQDGADRQINFMLAKYGFDSLSGKAPHSDHPLGPEDIDHVDQRLITGRKERVTFSCGKFVGSSVAPRLLKEGQWAEVPNEETLEERIGRAESFFRPGPDTSTTDFASGALQSKDWTLGMFNGGPLVSSRRCQEMCGPH